MKDRKDQSGWIDELRSRPAYRSIHDDGGPKIAGENSQFDWKVPLGFMIILLVVFAGLIVALRSVEPENPWLDLLEMKVTSDEAYLYVLITTAGDEALPDWGKSAYFIAIDTYGKDRGGRRLPAPTRATIPSGAEFLIELRGPKHSSLRVVQGYDAFDGEAPIMSPENSEAPFLPMRFQTNRERFGRDGTRYPPIVVHPGALRVSEMHSDSRRLSSLTDVAIDSGAIEIRIPWALLNVTDPSSVSVIHSPSSGRGSIDIRETEGFRIYAYSVNLEKEATADQIPPDGLAPLFRWDSWDSPSFTIEPKQGLQFISDELNRIPSRPERRPSGETEPDDASADR